MTDNIDTSVFDNNEKVNILLKKAFGFASTSENKQWYEETSVTYNNYLTGEHLFIDSIPQYPDFDVSGSVKTAGELGINSNDFINYSDNINNKLNCSIVDDSTGTIRRFKNLVLEQSPGINNDFGASWLKFDINNNNLLSDSLQFNYKQYNDAGNIVQPYLYSLYTQLSINTNDPDLPLGEKGGNWFFDTKTGLIFFSDFVNFSNGVQNDSKFQINNNNRPVLTYYKYIGRKGVSFLNNQITSLQQQINNLDNSSGSNNGDISLNVFNQVVNDLSLLTFEFNQFKNTTSSEEVISIISDTSVNNFTNRNKYLIKNFTLNYDFTDITILNANNEYEYQGWNYFKYLIINNNSLSFILTDAEVEQYIYSRFILHYGNNVLNNSVNALNILYDDPNNYKLEIDLPNGSKPYFLGNLVAYADDIDWRLTYYKNNLPYTSVFSGTQNNNILTIIPEYTGFLPELVNGISNNRVGFKQSISYFTYKNVYLGQTDLSLIQLQDEIISIKNDISNGVGGGANSVDISNLEAKFDTCFNYLDNLLQNISGIDVATTVLDISNSVVSLTQDVSNINIDITSIELSLNSIKNTIDLLDNTYLTDISFVNAISIIDNSFTSLDTKLSVIDNSFENISYQIGIIDNCFNSFNSNLNNFKTRVDLSLDSILNDISNISVSNEFQQSIDNSFANLTSLINNIDSSLNNINNKFDNSINSLNSQVNIIDNSLTNLNSHVNLIDSSLSGLTSQVHVIDTSLSDLTSQVHVIDTSLSDLTSQVHVIDSSLSGLTSQVHVIDTSLSGLNLKFDNSYNYLKTLISTISGANLSEQIVNISGNVNDLLNDVSTINIDINSIEISLNNIKNTINALDNTYLTDASFNSAINLIDNSFNIVLNKFNTLDNSFVKLDDLNNLQINIDSSFNSIKNTLDYSFNIINNTISTLETSFNSFNNKLNVIDNSINSINSSINLIDNSFNNVINKFNLIDTSFNTINNTIDVIDISLENFKNKFNIIETSLNSVISAIDVSFNNLNNKFNIVDSSFTNVLNEINDLDLRVYNSFDEVTTLIDNSFNYLNGLIQNICGGNGGGGGSTEFVNDVSQSFYEIMTQQPYSFDSSGIPTSITSSQIILNWNYDNILANHNNDVVYAKLSYLQNKTKHLPFINSIVIEISGIIDDLSNSSGWINYDTINIGSNDDYNTNFYKTFTINKYSGLINNGSSNSEKILSSITPFDVRIYGNNFSENYPTIENRSLYFNNIAFTLAQAPSKPNFVNENVDSNSQLTLTYNVQFNENNVNNSSATLVEYIIDYSQNETLASIIYNINSNDLSVSNGLPNVNSNTNFDVILSGLASGSKYNYSLAVQNNLNKINFSEYSNSRVSNYTKLPSSNNIGTTLDLNVSNDYTFISSSNLTNPLLNNSNEIYINLASNENIIMNNSNNQTIEISHPFYNNQENDTYGFGKFIDNTSSLVTLNVSVDNVNKQIISFDGSFNANNGNINNLNGSSFNYMELPNNSLLDIYSNEVNNNNKGFRLKGLLKLNNINNNEIVNAIGNASINPYILNYNYIRNNDVGGSNQNISYNIYVDNLSVEPVLTYSNDYIVNSVVYNMGIPSVETFNLILNRNYSNINSEFMFIRGDKMLSLISAINNTSSNSNKIIYLDQNNLNVDGSYNFNNTNLQNLTSINNYYNNINYSTSILSNNFSLTWNEYVYNLKNSNGVNNNISLTTNHYCDYNSFNKNGNKITSSLLTLNNIYEIDNINVLANNIGSINPVIYNNHNNLIKDHTLLFYNGNFRSNASLNYPIVNNFNYNGVSVNNFDSGNNSYDLDGILTNNNSGYKWIVFKFNMANDKTLHSTNSGNFYYLNVYQKLTSSPINFSSNILSKLKLDGGSGGSAENEVVGFIQQTYNSNVRIGRLDRNYKSTNIWYDQPSNISYNSLFFGATRANYGSIYNQDSNNWGPLLDINNGNNNMYLYIGFKNNVALV